MEKRKRHTPDNADSGGTPDSRESPPQRGRQIAAYVSGDMTPREAAAFERRMEADEILRREVEQWREVVAAAEQWAAQEVPGIERADGLTLPSLHPPRSWPALLSNLRLAGVTAGFRPRWLTACVFAAGFVLGALLFRQAPPSRAPAERETGPDTVMIGGRDEEHGTGAESGTDVKEPETPSIVEPGGERSRTRVAAAPGPRYVTQQDGRVVVETTLARSGARVTMIVDGGFQFPPRSENTGGER